MRLSTTHRAPWHTAPAAFLNSKAITRAAE